MNKTVKMIIAIIAAIILIIAIVLLIVKNQSTETENNESNIEVNNDISHIINTNDVEPFIKTWYSDRDLNDTLTLNEDGTYKGTKFLYSGMYKLNDGILTCTSVLDGFIEFQIKKIDEKICLYYENGDLSFYYHDTEIAASAVIEATEKEKEQKQKEANEAIPNILLGTWISTDEFNSTITFNETEYIIQIPESKYIKAEEHTYIYTIKNLSYEDNQYKIFIERTDTKGNTDNLDVKIIEKNNNYEISSNAFQFSRTFIKDKEDDINNTLQETQPPTDPLADRAALQLTENKNIEFENNKAAYIEEINKNINDMIIGTWKGSTGDNAVKNRIICTYIFNDNGTYKFTKEIESEIEITGFPYLETGTYIITHSNNTTDEYHSTLILSHGEQKTTKKFYIANTVNDTPISFNTDDTTDPTYRKEEEKE